MKKLLLILALSLPLMGHAQFSTVTCTHGETGTCRQATTCSQANVQAAVTASSAGTDGYISPTSLHGDGVYIPAGSCSWSSSVSWTDKNIGVIGGVGGTTTISPSGDGFDIYVTGAAGLGQKTAAAFRVSGITFSSGKPININPSNANMTTWAGYYRVDNIIENTSAGGDANIWFGPVYGVWDHDNMTVANTNIFEQAMLMNFEYPGTTSLLEGETVGRTFAIGLGDQNAVYIEHSTFSCNSSYGSSAISDSESGPQRMVFRYNAVTGSCFHYAHWTRNAEWDGGRIEIYNNSYNCNDASCPSSGGYPGRFDAGTGVIFNNTIVGYPVTSFQIDEARGCGAQTGGLAGECAGNPPTNSNVDVNAGDASAPGWPCGGQVGTACIAGSCTRANMNSVPFIMWNNGAQSGCSTGGSCTNSISFNVDGPPGGGSCTRTMTNYLKSTGHSLSGGYNGAIDYYSGSSQPSSVGIYTGIGTYLPFANPYPTTVSGGATYSWTVTATNGTVTGTNCGTATGITSGTTIGPCTAVPNAGYVFSSWSGVSGSAACSGATNPCPSFSITANSAVTANFVSGGVTVATGDTRTITEPTFPATCSTVQATKYIVSTNAVNIDPFNSTCGSTGGTNGTLGCTGGTSYEPSSTSGSYTAAETLDNSALTSALSACTSGKAVELVPGSSGQLGFVLSPLSLPSGVSLIVDAGIHVFASRNRTDYGGTNCGLVTSGTSGCNHWITAPSTTGSGIYGYGVLDGRGWDAYIGSTTQGFYSNRIQAYCNNHGGAINGSPACTPNGSGNNSYGPNGLNIVSATNFTLYKTTIKDSGNFIFNWSGGNGLTAWGTKLIAPFEVSNTDGFDPLNSKNGTFTHGIISNGDNHVAVKSTSSSSQNITVSNTQTGAGIALAIGTDINSPGTSNILFTNLIQRGNLYNSEAAGLQIGSSSANGGLVNIVSFINDCMVNEGNSVRLYTNYGGQTGSSPPQYTNVLLQNIHVLASTAPYTTGNSGKFTFQGLSGLPMGVQVNNFVIDGTNQGVASQSGVTTNQYANIFLGPGVVDSSLLTQFAAGTGVVTTGSSGSSTPYACTTSTWQPLVGDLNLKSATSNNNQSYTGPSPFTLQGVLQPATDISTKESPALTQPVTFLRDGVSIGTAPLLGDGSFASFTVSSSPVGTHLYTAQYPGDSYYPSFVFGSITVTNSTPVVTPPSFSVIFAQ